MSSHDMAGSTPLERLRSRYESAETRCPECGYVDDDRESWTSRSDGRRIVYHHVCPSCDADREHVFELRASS